MQAIFSMTYQPPQAETQAHRDIQLEVKQADQKERDLESLEEQLKEEDPRKDEEESLGELEDK